MAKETNLVPFGDYTQEEAQEEKEEIDREKQRGDFLKLVEGRNRLRIIPPPEERKLFVKIYQHFVQVEGGGMVVVNCPRMMKKSKFCPICQKAEALYASGNPLDRNKGYEMFAKLRMLCSVIDRSHPEDGIKIWSFGQKIYEQINELRNDPDDPCDFVHPTEGCDLYVDRKGKSKKTTIYTVRAGKTAKLAKTVGEMNELIMGQPDLDTRKQLPTDDDLLALANGEKPEREDRGALPADTRSSRGKRGRTAGDDIIDAEGEEVDDDDELPKDM
jgi:hypothetical protein